MLRRPQTAPFPTDPNWFFPLEKHLMAPALARELTEPLWPGRQQHLVAMAWVPAAERRPQSPGWALERACWG